MTGRRFTYVGRCDDFHGQPAKIALLDAMVAAERQVTLRTFLAAVGAAFAPWREAHYPAGTTPRLKDDWAIAFYSSKWGDRRCYFVRWSAYEVIYAAQT